MPPFEHLPSNADSEDVRSGQSRPALAPPVIFNRDARDINELISSTLIATTITSPPYYDVKDYGHENQVGFGQTYEDYLDSLRSIFASVYDKTCDTGSLWIVIDTFRKDQVVVPLPFDLARKLAEVGWKLRDIIVWKKDKTLPWLHHGTTRKIFEYILVFAKNVDRMKYFPDAARSHDDLARWWVKYPERYNPKGKSLEEVWEFPIPVQGSWGKHNPRHLCPLPKTMIQQIVKLTSNPGDVIFDPFTGTGVVPVEAALMGRHGLGIELDPALANGAISRFNALTSDIQPDAASTALPADFENTIIDLRVLKYARVICRDLRRHFSAQSLWVYVDRNSAAPNRKHALVRASVYVFLESNDLSLSDVLKRVSDVVTQKPLSKFGVEADIRVKRVFAEAGLFASGKAPPLYTYTVENSHYFRHEIRPVELMLAGSKWALVSPLRVALKADG